MGRPLLRVVTCGSVDDGKSTLIGRLADDLGQVPEDERRALAARSPDGRLDHALLLDGLAAEREQGITIDVAYRALNVAGRRLLLADAPGHEGYLRNTVTAASTADLAILLVDAARGIRQQTRRHAVIAALMRVRGIVLALNKMDLVDHDQGRFEALTEEFRRFAAPLGLEGLVSIPMVALTGGNLAGRDPAMPWYAGPTLTEHLAAADPAGSDAAPFRMPVQWISRPGPEFRGAAGMIAAGRLRPGDALRIMPSGEAATVARIVAPEGDRPEAGAGESVMLTLAEEVDCARGDVLCAAGAPLEVADQFEATLIWMSAASLLAGRPYLMKLGTRTVGASVTEIRDRLDVDTGGRMAARELALNDIGRCNLQTDRPIAFAPYAESRDLGGFILIDRLTNETAGAGMIRFALRRAANLRWQTLQVDRPARAALIGQRPRVIWFTGLSGAGKSTIANLVEARLHAQGRHTYLLDGDNVRHGLNRDLGFTEADRAENIRRIAEVARLMADAGLIVLVAAISPFRADRLAARERIGAEDFVEVFVDTPLSVAEARDPKGLYRKARAGQLANLTGLGSPYEAPDSPELRLDGTAPAEESARRVLDLLERA